MDKILFLKNAIEERTKKKMISQTMIAEANFSIAILSLIGLVIALYSYYVKISYYKNPAKYRALCDLNDSVSCTRVITSKYGSGFGFMGKLFGEKSVMNMSNSLLGSAFYILQFSQSKISSLVNLYTFQTNLNFFQILKSFLQ